MGRSRFKAAAVMAGAGFLISAALTHLHLRAVADPEGYKSFCNISPRVNCDAVALSQYAVVLGVPNSVYGALFYVLVAALATVGLRAARHAVLRVAGHLFLLASGGLLYSFYLGGISYFRLKTLCLLCSALYGVNLALFLVTGSLARGTPLSLVRHLISDCVAIVRGRWVLVAEAGCATLVILVLFGVLDARARDLAAERFLSEYEALVAVPIQSKGGVSFGPEDAPVTIVEFFDYGCLACRRAHALLKFLADNYATQVRLVLKDYPQCDDCRETDDPKELSVPCILPLVARYAHTQAKWWETSEALFNRGARLQSWDGALELATDIGLDTAGLTDTLVTKALLSDLRQDIMQARWLGVEEIPAFAVNGRILPVVPSRRMLESVIEFELAQRVERRGQQGGASAR